MNKEKQIEEMAIILSDGGCKKCDCTATGRFNCKLLYDAEVLYNAGYRKASDVARKIIVDFENDIDELLKSYIEKREKEWTDTLLVEHISGKIAAYSSVKFRLAELKKKYTEEGK